LAALLINSLACSSSSSSSALIADTTAPNAVTATGEPHNQPQQQQEEMQHKCLKGAANSPALRLSAVPRSFHCRARQDCPCALPGGEGGDSNWNVAFGGARSFRASASSLGKGVISTSGDLLIPPTEVCKAQALSFQIGMERHGAQEALIGR
jgi:hypothetical protein